MIRRFRHLPHTLRLGAFVLTAGLVGTLLSARKARADMHEGMRQLARQLMPYAQEGVMESPRRVQLNGESLYLAMGTTQSSPETVLDYYERFCNERAGRLTEQLREGAQAAGAGDALHQAAFNQLWNAPGRRSGAVETVRDQDSDGGGYVACLDVGPGRLPGPELVRRIERMTTTGDLSELGHMRYAYVTRGTTGTRILTVATDGRFNLFRMFPQQGDAPGEDLPGLPRYPGMTRRLSAREVGFDYGLGMYAVRRGRDEVRGWYRSTLLAQGWTALDLPRDRRLSPELERHRGEMLTVPRGEATLLLVFDEREGTTTMMSLAGL
jgi:hypothetical protein